MAKETTMSLIVKDFEKQLIAGNEILIASNWQSHILFMYFKEHFAWPSCEEPLMTCSDQLKYKGRPIVCIEREERIYARTMR